MQVTENNNNDNEIRLKSEIDHKPRIQAQFLETISND